MRDEARARLTTDRPLLGVLGLTERLPMANLGYFPTPVERFEQAVFSGREVFVKRDDRSSDAYGGNKVRTLEVLFGQALQTGFEQVVSTGAYGSNHAVATVVHAARLGLRSGVLLSPQPHSIAAVENLEVAATLTDEARFVPHWSLLPLGLWRWRRQGNAFVMPPGGATPFGALGYVSAALELALQVDAGQLPRPRCVVLPIGSTCTTAGLLVGFRLAKRLGIGFVEGVPLIHAVRVTPWPVTSPIRVVALARATVTLLAQLTADPTLTWGWTDLLSTLVVDGRFIGPGYGRVTQAGLSAIASLGEFGSGLDTTYSAKAAAGLIRVASERKGPLLFWATKSTSTLPAMDEARFCGLPAAVQHWRQVARSQKPAGAVV